MQYMVKHTRTCVYLYKGVYLYTGVAKIDPLYNTFASMRIAACGIINGCRFTEEVGPTLGWGRRRWASDFLN